RANPSTDGGSCARLPSETSLVGLPTAQREPRQARKGATVAESGCGRPFVFVRGTNDPMDVFPPTFTLKFVLSAALVALVIEMAVHQPLNAALAAVLVVLMMVPSYLARRRVREVLRSGDVRSVLSAWSDNIAKVPHPETMRPLITAAAFASCGW